MAPSRRKGANKSARAAPRRKWKVGDLVLAKVKGFPAWPATVSEPEKWGYSADTKKVLVYFFGTQQIAFCNPADVEEFTEEKKASLLGKRRGKGSDFVLALNEIIDCFEKLKKLDQVTSDDATEETNITIENNSDQSLTKYVKDEAPEITATNDLNSLTEAAVAAAAEDALHDEEMQMEAAHSYSVSTETRVYPTRSKSNDAQSRNIGPQRRISARRLRSSSRIDTNRLQNLMSPSINNTRSCRHLGTNSLRDRSLRRSKRIIKSSDDYEGHDVDSPAFVSNDSNEENDSEVMSVDSDTLCINDGIAVDSGCKPVGEEPFSENSQGETELSEWLDFQTNTTIIKKKRKPNRKRHRNETVLVAKPDVVVSEAEVHKFECVSPTDNENLAGRCAQEDGDEHLPLVKRARVRMGRRSAAGEEEGTLVHEEEKMLEVPGSFAIQSCRPLKCEMDAPADGESVLFKGDPGNLSLSHVSPGKMPHFCETKKNSVDGEAALPPSKRLHRALEAMSANVAEDSQRSASCSPTVNTHSNTCCSSSFMGCSELPMGKKAVIEMGSGQVEDHSNGDSQSSASEFCVGSNMEVSENDGKTSIVVSDCGNTCKIDSSNREFCEDSCEHAKGADSKCLKLSPLNECPAETDADHQQVNPDSPNIGEELAHSDCNTPCLIMPPSDGCKTDRSELNEVATGSDHDISHINSDSILVEEIAGTSLNIDTGTLVDSADGENDETNKTEHLSSSKNNQNSQKSDFVEEARPASIDSKAVPSAAPVKVLTSGHHGSTFHSNSIVSVTRSSSYLTDGPDSVARASPPSSAICNISASDNNYFLENNSSCSSDVQLHLQKAKLAAKSSSKGESLSSFESIIKSLTRTKESIGRATRIAIDCAKFGFATKVVEILARNLESETSLHKKVDLFFLVDSITQCSRGMKGDAGLYSSAIQALLPRLLLAAAPPGSSSHENHRQCLKVLRVWQERKILPEPIIRHHIRELDALCGSYPTGGSRRAFRNERAFDDPIREMEGMLVDEYGSNSSIQLPGFCMPPMLRDDDRGSDSDGESFEAVTPVHNGEDFDGETTPVTAVEKRSHILEDVDGELEMEDVAPCCEVEITSTSSIAGAAGADCTQMSHHQSDNNYGAPFATEQPKDAPLISAPLPRSPPHPPPPPPHPLPPSVTPHAVFDSVSDCPDSKLYLSSQNFNNNVQESRAKHSVLPRVKPRTLDPMHHRVHDHKDFEAHAPRQMPDCSNACFFSDQPTSHLSDRASNGIHPVDGAFRKGFHLHPPQPAPSNQFSYVQEQRIQSRRDVPPPSHPTRYHTRNAENGNFYRNYERNKFASRDNIGEHWRPPCPSISGPCYHDGSRMAHAPMPYSGPPREPALPKNSWNFPPRPMDHRQFTPYRPPF